MNPLTGSPDSPVIDRFNQKIVFYNHNDEAGSVALAGSFNGWKPNSAIFARVGRGVWHAEISMLPKGVHSYKFVIDNREWVTDPGNSHCESDDFNGLNSVFIIDS